jgi:hypothetical protein
MKGGDLPEIISSFKDAAAAGGKGVGDDARDNVACGFVV